MNKVLGVAYSELRYSGLLTVNKVLGVAYSE